MRKFLIGIMAILLLPIYALSYETNVHWKISDNAINGSIIRSYLKSNLNISLEDYFDNKTGSEWLREGSRWEDQDISLRWLNHFYDPITGRGLNPCVAALCNPSLQWGKESSDNAWSWKWARDSYYKALTDTNPTYRNIYFSYVFRSLGQVIHLVQDLASPAHVRNDPHGAPIIKYDMYETFTRDNAGSLTYGGYPAVSITSFNSFDKFWVNGGNGLAEYTNKNFFSRDTIFKNYQHPAKENTTAKLVEQTAKDGKLDKVWYIQGYTSERLAAYSYFWKNGIPPTAGWLYHLDNYVHQDYASQLIPRAVGYSAGLLNYFFRGTIGIEYDQNTPEQYAVLNLSSERMNGTFALYYDDSSGNRYSIESWRLDIPAYSLEYVPLSACNLSKLTPEPKKFILVFQGTMGNETGAVVGNANIEPLTSACGTNLTISGLDRIPRNTTQQYTTEGYTEYTAKIT